MARVAEYLISIFEDAIREGNYDIKDITKKALAKRKELKLSGFAGGEEVILRNFKTYLADKNSMSVEEYTKYIKDRINNPELPQTPNWNRPLAGTPFEAKGIGATKNTPVGNLNKALASLTDEEKAAWKRYTNKQQRKVKEERKFKASERFDKETGKFVYDPNVRRDALAKKYLRKAKRRALKAGAYAELTPNEKLKFEFFDKRISIMGDLIKKKPNYLLGNEEVVKALSTVVDPNTGKISSRKPTFTDLKKRRVFEIEHIDPIIEGQTKGRGSFLRNLQVLPEPIHRNFKNNAEKFLNKNFTNPKYSDEVKNILEKANELKVELRIDDVGKVGYKPKFENFLDKADDVINFYVRDADAKMLYSKEIENLKPANVKYNWRQLGFAEPPSTEIVNQIINETTRPAFAGTGVAKEGVLIDNFVKKVQSVQGGCQAVVRRALGNKGGLFNETCETIIKADPEKAALKLNNAITATKGPLKDLKEDSQKLIRLYRGEGFKLRSGPTIKEMAKTFDVSEAEAKKKLLSGQWFTSDPVAASSYTDKLGKTKYVDVTPKEFMDFKRYVDRVNKTKSLSGGERFAVNTTDKLSIIPRYKLKEFEEAGKLKSERNIFKDFNIKSGYMERAEGVLSYDSVKGGFVDPADPTTIVNQDQIKAWAEANPEKVTAGTEAVEAATNKSVLSNVAKSLARVGAPLPVAAIDSYFIGKQVAEGKGTAEIASNPLNWLGLATMEPLAKASGIAQPGKLNAILRLGLNPATIRGITRFAGLPGLAVSTAMTAYDQYQKYKDGEGFIFNLLNQKGTE